MDELQPGEVVRVGQRARHLARHLHGCGHRYRPPSAGRVVEQLLQIVPFDEFLRDEGLTVDLSHRVGLHDVAVNQPARQRRGSLLGKAWPRARLLAAPIGCQRASVDLAAETYGTTIAPARTFGYKADEKRLRDMGLIRGAAPECAIILGPTGPENGPLRFADEYVRHKVLDLIGDLALAGRRIEGRVVADRAGHAMHTALVSRLLKDRSAWELAHVPVAVAPAEETLPVTLPDEADRNAALMSV